jgi:hypothetical protein
MRNGRGVSSIPPRKDVQASRVDRSMAHGVGFAPLPVDRYRPVGRFGASRRARTRGRIGVALARLGAGRLRPPPQARRRWFWSPDPAWHLRCHWRLWLGPADGGPRTSHQHQSVLLPLRRATERGARRLRRRSRPCRPFSGADRAPY